MKILTLLFTPLFLFAQMLHVGDTLKPLKVNDQFDKEYTLSSQKLWMIAWDRSTTSLANEYASSHIGFLDTSKQLVYVDTSQIPSGIYTFFVLSRMQDFKHPIMQGFDEEYNKKLPYKESHITILKLDKGKIISIEFVDNMKDLTHLFLK